MHTSVKHFGLAVGP